MSNLINAGEFVNSFSKITGISKEKIEEFVLRRGLFGLIESPESVCETKTQKEKVKAFKELIRIAPQLDMDEKLYILDTPEKAAKFALGQIKNISSEESMLIIYLNVKNQAIDTKIFSAGSIKAVQISPQAIFRGAILNNAAGFIVIHNHPSGTPTPSDADRKITRRIKDAGDLLDIEMIDHIIVSPDGKYYSFMAGEEFKLNGDEIVETVELYKKSPEVAAFVKESSNRKARQM